MVNNVKLLILSESPLDRIGEDYYAVDPWVRIPCYLSMHCDKVTLWAPVRVFDDHKKPAKDSWKVDLGKLKIEPLDPYVRFVDYYRLLPRKFLSWKRAAKRLLRGHDLTLIRAPSPMAPLLVNCVRRQKHPLVFMILLNLATQSDRIIQSRGLKKLIYKMLLKLFIYQERKAVKNSKITYVYSQELAERHHKSGVPIKMIQDSHLRLGDITPRLDTCQGPEIRLLRICWLIPSKGVEYLLEAVTLLLKRGLPVRLDIVGQEREAGYQASLEKYAQDLGIQDKVHFSGWLPFDRVGEAYLRNDIQILSSLGEGTPRCIVEGFARGLPLVCSNVGGCADTLVHEQDALMVPPADPKAIADAVEKLIREGELRRKLIQNGLEKARQATFENLGMQFLNEIQQVVA